MKLMPSARRRAGFTLIELLVVIAIIAILVSLLGAGIFYAFVVGQDTGARNEISQLDQSMKAFKGKYGVYPPDRMILFSTQTEYAKAIAANNALSPLAQTSLSYINRLWPNIGAFGSSPQNPPLCWADGVSPFNQPGSVYKNVPFIILEGDQCLVYFLQGPPLNGSVNPSAPTVGGTGFSTNPKAPLQPSSGPSGAGRVGPFYNFVATRFMPRPNGVQPTNLVPPSVAVTSPLPLQPPGIFLSYMDYFSSPPGATQWAAPQSTYRAYFFFSANNSKNGYDPTLFIQPPPNDLLNANLFVYAYFQPFTTPMPKNPPAPPMQFQNPDTGQIISAGRDGKYNALPAALNANRASAQFMTGVYASPFQWASTDTSHLIQQGKDDLTNFYDSKLGVSQ